MLILVEWIDSIQPCSEWSYLTALPEVGVATCQSVGWLVSETEDTVMLAPNLARLLSDEDVSQGSGFFRIPKVAIIKQIELEAIDKTALVPYTYKT